MNLSKFTPAEAMIRYRGISYAKKYLDRTGADKEGAPLYVCSAGHVDCAHYKKGPCSAEIAALIKAH